MDRNGWREKLSNQYGLSFTMHECHDPEEAWPTSLLQGHDVLFCEFPPANFGEMKDIRWVQAASVGVERWSLHSLPAKQVGITNAAGIFDAPIAEWNLSMMINLARDLRGMIHNQAAHVWDRSPRFQMEIRGKILGLWGYGGIGRETARLAKALGMKIHVYSRNPIGPRGCDVFVLPGSGDPEGTLPDRVFSPDDKLEFLASVDFLVLGVPLTPETEGMIGREELKAMASHAFLLNPARGKLIQEDALRQCLEEQWIAGAALDTHYAYPLPAAHWLWDMSNVILTPHISGSHQSPHFLNRIWSIFAENVRRFQQRERLMNLVASETLAR